MRTALLLMLLAAGGCKPRTSLPQTDPKTWSKGGWQDFRWGMGPGDVELLLREAKGDLAPLGVQSLPPFEPGASEVRWIELTQLLPLAGRPARVRLGFYRSGLFRAALSANFPGPVGETTPTVAEWNRKEREDWRQRVVRLLTEKYGQPSEDDGPDKDWRVTRWRLADSTIEVFSGSDALVPSGQRAVTIGYDDPVRSKLADEFDPAEKSKL